MNKYVYVKFDIEHIEEKINKIAEKISELKLQQDALRNRIIRIKKKHDVD